MLNNQVSEKKNLTKQKNQDLRRWPGHKVPATQGWGLEFASQGPTQKGWVWLHMSVTLTWGAGMKEWKQADP